MNKSDPAALQHEFNERYAREGRYLAAWLELFPDDSLVSPPEPDELVRRYHALLPLVGEREHLRKVLAGRQALIEKEEVQAALWIGTWPLCQWPPFKRAVLGLLRQFRALLRPR